MIGSRHIGPTHVYEFLNTRPLPICVFLAAAHCTGTIRCVNPDVLVVCQKLKVWTQWSLWCRYRKFDRRPGFVGSVSWLREY